MPLTSTRESFTRSASLATLSLTSFAAGCAGLIAWFAPLQRPLDMVLAPLMCAISLVLLAVLIRRPSMVGTIMRLALLTALAALVAPAWFYTVQASLQPSLRLIDIYPPVASLLLVLMVMAMIYLPTRQGVAVVVLGWLLVALPVLLYLFFHPAEMHTPRGADLLMTYGPVFILFVVLLPVHRGLSGRIRQLVTEQVRMEAMVNLDPLTQIHNRRFSELVLQDMLIRHSAAGVIMFDMDHFKSINDTHGHPAGDRVLQGVAQRCHKLLRKNECLARWGGDEFLIAVPDVDLAALQALAERLRQAIAELSIEQVPATSASLGITLLQRGDSMETLLQRVDLALYRAKKQGGNAVAW